MADYVSLLAALGVLVVLSFVFRLAAFIFQYMVASASFAQYKGEWAVVTGASAGIGSGFVRQLAKKGINVVLLARSVEKMEAIAKQCHSLYGVDTIVIPFDFANADESQYNELAAQLVPLSPKVLVNNVGVTVGTFTDFTEMTSSDVDWIVKVNVESINKMTAMLVPSMLSAKRGIIYCLSSAGGVVAPAPLIAAYAGTKAYADAFALSLASEVGPSGVIVHSLTPFYVESKMAKLRKSITVPTADDFASKSLDQTGLSARLSPYWIHFLMGAAINILPLSLQVALATNVNRGIQRRVRRKLERRAR